MTAIRFCRQMHPAACSQSCCCPESECCSKNRRWLLFLFASFLIACLIALITNIARQTDVKSTDGHSANCGLISYWAIGKCFVWSSVPDSWVGWDGRWWAVQCPSLAGKLPFSFHSFILLIIKLKIELMGLCQLYLRKTGLTILCPSNHFPIGMSTLFICGPGTFDSWLILCNWLVIGPHLRSSWSLPKMISASS